MALIHCKNFFDEGSHFSFREPSIAVVVELLKLFLKLTLVVFGKPLWVHELGKGTQESPGLIFVEPIIVIPIWLIPYLVNVSFYVLSVRAQILWNRLDSLFERILFQLRRLKFGDPH